MEVVPKTWTERLGRMSIYKRSAKQWKNKMTAAMLCLLFLLGTCYPMTVRAAETEQKTVRVGFYACPFNMKDENGHMSGYAYDYQQDLAAYTGWKYDYVEGSWPELLQMLKNGEIDLLSDVSITPERETEMLFSSYSMGTESYYLYVSNRDNGIDQNDYSTLEGKRIGVNAGSIQDDLFHEWAKEHALDVETIPCNGDYAMLEMLENDKLDAVIAVDSYAYDHTVPMIRIGSSDFYFAVNSDRPDLKAELDEAMQLLLSTNRYYNEELLKKYLNANASKSLPSEDSTWLQEHGTIRVGYLDDYLAFCDKDDASGELVGALREFLNIAENCLYHTRLEFEPIVFSDATEMRSALQRGEVDCIFPVYFDRYSAEQSQMYVTKSVAGTSMIALVNGGGFHENVENVVAIYENSIETKLFIQNNYPSWTVLDAGSEEECIRMVRRGDADCAVFSANRVDHIIPTSWYDGLTCVTLSSNASVSFAVQRKNVHLLHILNQVINAVPDSVINETSTYYATTTGKTTFEDFIKDNALAVIAVIFAVAAVFVLISLIYVKKIREASKEVREALILAEHANQAKTNFLNNMSHDIRTPMNAIIGFTSLAATHLDDKKLLEDYLTKIMTSSNHLLSLINDVLDMSRIESGRIKIEEQECHLSTVMHDLRNILQADVNAKRLNFLIDTVEVMNEDIVCDKLRLNQVLLNCMSNAIKFTLPGGTVGIRIIQKGAVDSEGFVRYEFVVSDTGIGMNEEFAKHIFEPFTREESSTVSGIPGTGLGMAITKNIVDMMGGNISVKSKKGAGTEFTISFRFRVGEHSHKVTTIKNLEGLRALVADDNMDTCASVTRMLEVIGMNPEWTMSGKEAVYKAKFAYEGGKPYKAFIIDWLMPDMNGVEVVRRIRSVIGEDTPIIILTAYDWSEIEEEARKAGVTAFCAKPLFLSDLYEILNASVDAEPKRPSEKKEHVHRKGSRILLVEDNDLNREIAVAILSEMDVLVEEAENGSVAVEMVRSAPVGYYQMVLMDIQMPVMDGYEATRLIRALDRPDISTLPIIAVSANAFEEDKMKSKTAGMDEHIAKPFNQEKLENVIDKYLRDSGRYKE